MGREKIEKKEMADFKLLTKLFFRLLPYQILLLVITAVNGIVDGLFASNIIGNDGMSAIGLYGPMNHFLYALSIMLLSGSQLLYGKYISRNPEDVNSVFSVDMIMSAGISAAVAVLLVIASVTDATAVMVKDPLVREMFNRYLIGQAVGIPALVIGQQLFAFLSLENQTKLTMGASIICFASNVLLDYLLIVVFPMGTLGLGLATSLSTVVFMLVQMIYYLRGCSSMKFSLKACSWKDAPEIIKRGYSGAISRFVEMFRCLVVNWLILACVGSVGLSSFAASNSFLAVIWAVPFGMIAVSRMLFSVSVGEEDRRSLTDIMRISFVRCVPLMSVIALLIILLAHPLTRMFFRDPSDPVYHMTVMGFRILPLCMPPAVISLTFTTYAQAAEKKILSVLLPIIDGFAGVTLTSLFLIPLLKMNGLYIANVVNGFICFLVVWLYARSQIHRSPRTIEDLMAVPEDFGTKEEERIDVTVRKIEEVRHLAQKIISFCTDRGIDRRRAYYSGLALEEMAGNVVLHGFNKDKRKHSADIRVIHREDEDEILLRIRDDCAPFDPSDREKLSLRAKEDPYKNIGIQLVLKIAKDVQYQNLLGCNVLTIRI